MVTIARLSCGSRWSRGGDGGGIESHPSHSIDKPKPHHAKPRATQVMPNPFKSTTTTSTSAPSSSLDCKRMPSRIIPLESSPIASSSADHKSVLTSLVQGAVRRRQRSSLQQFDSDLSRDESTCLFMSTTTLDDSTTSMSSGGSSNSANSNSPSISDIMRSTCLRTTTATPVTLQAVEVSEVEDCPSDEDAETSGESSQHHGADMAAGGGAQSASVEGVQQAGEPSSEKKDEEELKTATKERGSSSDSRSAVRWGVVEIHSHAITLGDNVCSSGPPVSIDWTAFASTKLELDKYERCKPPARHKGEMLLPAWVREDMLREAGYPRSAVIEAREAVAEAKRHRIQSSRDGRLRESIVSLLKGKKKSSTSRRSSDSYTTATPSSSSQLAAAVIKD